MIEPVAWQAKQGLHTQYLYDKISADYAQANGWKITPLYAHPAPAPTGVPDVEYEGYLCVDHNGDRWFQDRGDYAVPDDLPKERVKLVRATALAALQSKVDTMKHVAQDVTLACAKNSVLNRRIKELEAQLSNSIDTEADKILAMSDDQIKALCAFTGHHPDDEAQLGRKAFEVAMLKAKLAEAVGLLEEALPSIETVASSFENTQDKWHAAFVHRIKAAIEKAGEVMG